MLIMRPYEKAETPKKKTTKPAKGSKVRRVDQTMSAVCVKWIVGDRNGIQRPMNVDELIQYFHKLEEYFASVTSNPWPFRAQRSGGAMVVKLLGADVDLENVSGRLVSTFADEGIDLVQMLMTDGPKVLGQDNFDDWMSIDEANDKAKQDLTSKASSTNGASVEVKEEKKEKTADTAIASIASTSYPNDMATDSDDVGVDLVD